MSGCALLDHSEFAVVDHNYHWLPVDDATPRGVKLQLIDERYGVAVYGRLDEHNSDAYTHWAPLPTFDRRTKVH